MARRAEQGSTARCPWCEASLPSRAVECPDCRFPVTMDGALPRQAEDGPAPAATIATLRPITGLRPAAPRSPAPPARFPHIGPTRSRSHRLMLVAGALAVTALLVLVSGFYTWRQVNSPGAKRDRAAIAALDTALLAARGRGEPTVALLGGDEPSTASNQISAVTDTGRGAWYGAIRSDSGTCIIQGGRLDVSQGAFRGGLPGVETHGGIRTPAAPCTGAEAQRKLAKRVAP